MSLYERRRQDYKHKRKESVFYSLDTLKNFGYRTIKSKCTNKILVRRNSLDRSAMAFNNQPMNKLAIIHKNENSLDAVLKYSEDFYVNFYKCKVKYMYSK